jgi:hypothetical protein
MKRKHKFHDRWGNIGINSEEDMAGKKEKNLFQKKDGHSKNDLIGGRKWRGKKRKTARGLNSKRCIILG